MSYKKRSCSQMGGLVGTQSLDPMNQYTPSRPMSVQPSIINNGYADQLASQNLPINPMAPGLYQYDNKVQSVKQSLSENKDIKYAGDVADETAQKKSVDYSKLEHVPEASTSGVNTGSNIAMYGGNIANLAKEEPKINKPGFLSKFINGEPTMNIGGKTVGSGISGGTTYDQNGNVKKQ